VIIVRVGINVFPFSSKSFSGHNPYTRDLIAALISHQKQHAYFILTSPENHAYFAQSAANCQTICIHEVLPEPERRLPAGIERSRQDGGAPTASESERGLESGISAHGEDVDAADHCDLYDCIDSLSLDVLFCPWIDAEWDKISVASVVMVADILQEYHPEVLSAEENAWRHTAFRQACRAATQVICISEFTRKTVIERFDVGADKVHAVPSAVSEKFNLVEAESSWKKVQQQFHLEKGYLFLPATTWAHKNHLRLFTAMGELKRRGLTPHLVLTGGHRMPQGELMAAAGHAGCADQIQHLGFVDQQFMPGLYHGASALVFPSVFEGFGLPALEALSLECPLLCSDIEVFREVVGDAALTFDPLDPMRIADAIEKLIKSPGLSQDLRRRGSARAAEFSWPRMARNTVQILEGTAREPGNQPIKPFVQGMYPDNWTGPRCFIKRIDRQSWRELLIEGDVPAGCGNVTVAVLRDGACVSALHSQEPGRFELKIDWPDSNDDQPYVDIELLIDRHIVPKELGLSSDLRRLSFLVLSLILFDRQGNPKVLRGKYDPSDYALSADSGFTSRLSGRNAQ
jgi:glycosyltransferase involved in cell wall biosynthesis